jgi:hypothetical protein
MPIMDDHKDHIEEQIGHLTLQLLQESQHPISLMVDQYVISRGAAIQKYLGLDESAIREVIQYALLQGMELLEWRATKHPHCEGCKKDLAAYIRMGNMTWLPSPSGELPY